MDSIDYLKSSMVQALRMRKAILSELQQAEQMVAEAEKNIRYHYSGKPEEYTFCLLQCELEAQKEEQQS